MKSLNCTLEYLVKNRIPEYQNEQNTRYGGNEAMRGNIYVGDKTVKNGTAVKPQTQSIKS